MEETFIIQKLGYEIILFLSSRCDCIVVLSFDLLTSKHHMIPCKNSYSIGLASKTCDLIQGRNFILCFFLCLLTGCWYGPPLTNHRIESAVRKPNEYTSVALVYTEVSKPPQGLATFPNGGISKLLKSEFTVSILNPMSGAIREVFHHRVPNDVKNAFSASFAGWEEESVFLQLSGCSGAECWGKYVNYIFYRLNESGGAVQVDHIPDSAKFKGESLSPMPGEKNYLRLGHTFGEISMTIDAGKTSHLIYTLNRKTGAIETAGE